METDWKHLHDASLIDITIDWAEGTSILQFAVDFNGYSSAKLIAQGTAEFHCPRQHPWGESVSVNEVRFPSPNAIEIEMQSGDVIRMNAHRFSLKLSSQSSCS